MSVDGTVRRHPLENRKSQCPSSFTYLIFLNSLPDFQFDDLVFSDYMRNVFGCAVSRWCTASFHGWHSFKCNLSVQIFQLTLVHWSICSLTSTYYNHRPECGVLTLLSSPLLWMLTCSHKLFSCWYRYCRTALSLVHKFYQVSRPSITTVTSQAIVFP
jgi:hypothetical protein